MARNRELEKQKAIQNMHDGWCRNHPGVKPRFNSTLCEYCSERTKKNRQKHIQNGRCRNQVFLKM